MSKSKKIAGLSQNEELLTALDLFDLDESVIDEKLSEVMRKTNIKTKHFNIILSFIKYKYIINIQEETDCENDAIVQFTLKQIIVHLSDTECDIFATLLEILSISLTLNMEKIQANIEHIIQQVLSLTELCSFKSEEEISTTIKYISILNTVLDVSVSNNLLLESRFINDEIMKLLTQEERRVNMLLLSKTIPKILHCCNDSNILNTIWERITTKLFSLNLNDFVTVCSLSDYYFPSNHENLPCNFSSNIVIDSNFWIFIHHGLIHDNYSARKCSIFLIKKAVDYSSQCNKSFAVKTNGDLATLFLWNAKEKLTLEKCWSNYFVLLETLEEKQSHLVLSAVHIFENLGHLPHCWNNLAIRRALSHESTTVKIKIVEKVLQSCNSNEFPDSFPYAPLLHALNTISFYENAFNYEINKLIPLLKTFLSHENVVRNVIKNINFVDWSPIPKFYIHYSLMSIDTLKGNLSVNTIMQIFEDQLSSAQNNFYIRHGTQNSLTYFAMKQLLNIPNIVDFLHFLESHILRNDVCRNGILWNDIVSWIKRIKFDGYSCEPITDLFYTESWKTIKLSEIHARVKMLLIFVDANIVKKESFVDLVNTNIQLMNESADRQYANPIEFDQYFFFIVNVLNIVSSIEDFDKSEELLGNIVANYDATIKFLIWRCHTLSPIDGQNIMDYYVNMIDKLFTNKIPKELAYSQAERLMASSVMLLCSSEAHFSQCYLAVKTLSMAVCYLHNNMSYKPKQNMENLKTLNPVIDSYRKFKVTGIDNKELKGKLLSNFKTEFSKICYYYYEAYREYFSMKQMEEIVSDLLQTGGYGCLLWVIKISQLLLPEIIIENACKADMLVNRIWTEVFGVRKNENFKICITAFVEMVFQQKLFENIEIHNLLTIFTDKIFELGELCPFVIQIFMKNLCILSKSVNLNSFIEVLSKGILFGTVSRKDQRIEADTCLFIASQKHLNPPTLSYENPLDIIRTSITNILIAQNMAFHDQLCKNLRDKLDTAIKSKNRYHGNSIHHRVILRTLQCLLLSYKLYPNGNSVDNSVNWCIAFLTKQPHHISARIMLEWYVALYFIRKRIFLNQDVVERYQLLQLPQLSYFMIVYHIVRHQLNEKSSFDPVQNEIATEGISKDQNAPFKLRQNNFHFAMILFMSHTMGQLFTIRLHAQFLSLKLYESAENIQDSEKYFYIIDIIKKTFKSNIQEKSFLRIKDDFYINNFDGVCNLSLENIYHHVPRLTGVSGDEWVTLKHLHPIDEYLKIKCPEQCSISIQANVYNLSVLKTYQTIDCLENSPTEENVCENVQKKYLPWKNMFEDLSIPIEEEIERKTSGLIVVASLIDRMPNLGGLARTCEVFGVKQYVIDNIRHTQDKIFQNLSVSSERWLDIAEVKPGHSLKNYLMNMKERGYSIIGVEQTSSSVPLNKFNFPKNTVLLLGHEKEGVPSNLLSMMDYCVEIPQYGKIRSLNVHVTASIFVWEYGKQHPIL